MNALQLGAIAQHNWELNAKESWHSYEPNSTWAGDLAIAMFYEKVEQGAMERTIQEAIMNWKNEEGHHMLIMLGCAINYMAWFCDASNTCEGLGNWTEYTQWFSDRYYQFIDEMDKIDTNIYARIHYYLD